MRFRLLLVVLAVFLVSFVFLGFPLLTRAEEFPFIGVVTGDRVNVRARSSLASEPIFQLSRGFKVRVLEKQNGWYAITLPDTVPVYISKSMVELKDQTALMKGKKVPVRSGPGEAYSAVGFLTADEGVPIRQVVREWVEIRPNESCRGWINSAYVAFFEAISSIPQESTNDHHRPISPTGTESRTNPGSEAAPERR